MAKRTSEVRAKISLDTAEASRNAQKFSDDFEKSFKGMRDMVASGIMVKFAKDLAAVGVSMNQTLEDARIGIATVLQLTDPRQFEDFNVALRTSTRLIEDLKDAAMKSAATFDELARSYGRLAGTMTTAGIPLDRQVELTVLLANATKLFASTGRDEMGYQLIQESRALLQGRFDPRSAVGQVLFPTEQDQARVRAAMGTPQMYEILMSRLKELTDGMEASLESFSVLMANAWDKFKIMMGEATEGLFDEMKQQFETMIEVLQTPEAQQGMKAFGDMLSNVVAALGALANFAANNPFIVKIGMWAATITTAIAGIGGALRFLVGSLRGWAFVLPYAKAIGRVAAGLAFNLGRSAALSNPVTATAAVAAAAAYKAHTDLGEAHAMMDVEQGAPLAWADRYWKRTKAAQEHRMKWTNALMPMTAMMATLATPLGPMSRMAMTDPAWIEKRFAIWSQLGRLLSGNITDNFYMGEMEKRGRFVTRLNADLFYKQDEVQRDMLDVLRDILRNVEVAAEKI